MHCNSRQYEAAFSFLTLAAYGRRARFALENIRKICRRRKTEQLADFVYVHAAFEHGRCTNDFQHCEMLAHSAAGIFFYYFFQIAFAHSAKLRQLRNGKIFFNIVVHYLDYG